VALTRHRVAFYGKRGPLASYKTVFLKCLRCCEFLEMIPFFDMYESVTDRMSWLTRPQTQPFKEIAERMRRIIAPSSEEEKTGHVVAGIVNTWRRRMELDAAENALVDDE